MSEDTFEHTANEPSASMTYGMSDTLRDSGLLRQVENLNHKDRIDLIRYIYRIDSPDVNAYDNLCDDEQPYTVEELYARLDESEAEAERGEGMSFDDMMSGFKEQLPWLK